MELNKKILKLGLIFIGIVLIMGFSFALYIKLDNPVFLKSYIEKGVNSDIEYYEPLELQIRYITNVYDTRQINYIELIDNDKDIFKLQGYRRYDRAETYGLYNVNTIGMEINQNDIIEDFDRLEFNNAKITFNNGDTMDVDLGRIILHRTNLDMDYFESRSSSGSSDGTSSSIDILKEEINLIKLESLLFKNAENLFDIKINGKDYGEISDLFYKKGDSLRVDSAFKNPKDILNKYTQFELQPRLYFEDSKGKKAHVNIYNIRHIPYYFKFGEIFNYLKLRGQI